ncbi:MAG: MMPL family transporter, partial [Deltaproteobacteria bacterium]|nr:MMPL family transporter [Deltaproteobacteria bacterium]
FIIEKRIPVLIIISLISIFFVYNLLKLKVYTKYADLLPQRHEYIKVHNSIRARFGGANTVNMILQVREGDIFNPTTLQKVRDITDELFYIPGVDRFKILSISVNMLLDLVVTSGGFDFQPIMWPDVPQTPEEIEKVKERVYSGVFYGNFVWFDSKKTLITADFFEDEIEYNLVFKELIRIQKKYEDENHILSINGEPMHLGYVDACVEEVFFIMIGTFLVMIILFYLWYRSFRATLIPFLAALLSGVWGLGFMCMLGYNLDPLILVFPFLVASRAACHTVQVIKRYTEECLIVKEGKSACKRVIEGMFKPGVTAITTDAMGIILIALTPIQILQKITLTCTFWCIAQIIIAVILVPIILSFLPISSSLLKKFERKGILDRILAKVGSLIGGKGSLVVFAMVPILIFLGYLGARNIQVGDAVPGSSLFWPWHRYNRDGFRISFSVPILSPLYIVMEGENQYDLVSCPGKREICGENFAEMYRFQKFILDTPGMLVMFIDSIIKTFPGTNWLMHEGDPNWNFFPTTDRAISALYSQARNTGVPGSTDRYCDCEGAEKRTAVNIIYCRDKMTPTIKTVMARVKEYIEKHSRLQPSMRYKLAGGAFGVQAAVNEVIEEYHLTTLLCALGAIFIICWVMFRSFVAAVMLTVPLIVANLIAFSMMATGMFYLLPTPITITTSTLPVSAVGVGLGVDYGIYMLGRILEEYKIGKDLTGAIRTTMTSVGEPVVFTALAMTGGLIVWVFSPLMFQATMGFFLATILLLNMLGGLLLVPSFVAVVKPRFVVE